MKKGHTKDWKMWKVWIKILHTSHNMKQRQKWRKTNSWNSFGYTPSYRVQIAEGELLPSPRGVETGWVGMYFRKPGGFVATLTKARASLEKTEQQLPDEPDQSALLCLVFIISMLFVKQLWKLRDSEIGLSSHCCCCCGRQTCGAFCTTTIIGWWVSLRCESLEKFTSTPPKNKSFAFSQCDLPKHSVPSQKFKKIYYFVCDNSHEKQKQMLQQEGETHQCTPCVLRLLDQEKKKKKKSDIRWNRRCSR